MGAPVETRAFWTSRQRRLSPWQRASALQRPRVEVKIVIEAVQSREPHAVGSSRVDNAPKKATVREAPRWIWIWPKGRASSEGTWGVCVSVSFCCLSILVLQATRRTI